MPEREMAGLWELRPLPAAVPRRDGGAVVFSVEDREVRVDGDVATVERLVSLCDGHRTLAEIATALEDAEREEVQGLAQALLDHGALVDCTQAYRVFHWQSSIESGYFREVDDAEVAALAAEEFRPDHLEDPRVAIAPVGSAVRKVAAGRGSALPQRGRRAVSFTELSSLLEAMYASHRDARRPVPSGGALYPLVLHVVARTGVDSLGPGLWWYEPSAAALRLLRDHGLGLDEVFLGDPLSDALLAAGGPVVFVSANLDRTSRVYANRGYRWALIEVGAVMQNAYLVAAELDVPVRAIGGFRDERAHAFLELPAHVRPMLALLLGR
jgi:SagB-type dehydrogenase family enzyme